MDFAFRFSAVRAPLGRELQLHEIRLHGAHGSARLRPTFATNPDGASPAKQGPRNMLLDESQGAHNSWCDLNFGSNSYRSRLRVTFADDAPAARVQDYEFITARDHPLRDPIAWSLLTRPRTAAARNWTIVDVRNATPPRERLASYGRFRIPLAFLPTQSPQPLSTSSSSLQPSPPMPLSLSPLPPRTTHRSHRRLRSPPPPPPPQPPAPMPPPPRSITLASSSSSTAATASTRSSSSVRAKGTRIHTNLTACAPTTANDDHFEGCYGWCGNNYTSNCARCKCRQCPFCRRHREPASGQESEQQSGQQSDGSASSRIHGSGADQTASSSCRKLLVIIRGEAFRDGGIHSRVSRGRATHDPWPELAALRTIDERAIAPARAIGWRPIVVADVALPHLHAQRFEQVLYQDAKPTVLGRLYRHAYACLIMPAS